MYINKIIAIVIYLFILGNIKAFICYKLGDVSAKKGITVKPWYHIEPIGLIMLYFFNVGWGKSIHTNMMNYKNREAGILLSNLIPIVLSFILGYIANIALLGGIENETINIILMNVMIISFSNGIFNIIPIAPLHGEKIFKLYGNSNITLKLTTYEKVFQMVLMLAVTMGYVTNFINKILKIIIIGL